MDITQGLIFVPLKLRWWFIDRWRAFRRISPSLTPKGISKASTKYLLLCIVCAAFRGKVPYMPSTCGGYAASLALTDLWCYASSNECQTHIYFASTTIQLYVSNCTRTLRYLGLWNGWHSSTLWLKKLLDCCYEMLSKVLQTSLGWCIVVDTP